MLHKGLSGIALALLLAGCSTTQQLTSAEADQSAAIARALQSYQARSLPSFQNAAIKKITVRKGDSILALLRGAGADVGLFHAMSADDQAHFSRLHPGDQLALAIDRDGRLTLLAQKVENAEWRVAEKGPEGVTVSYQPLSDGHHQQLLTGKAGTDLARGLRQAGVPDAIAEQASQLIETQAGTARHRGGHFQVLITQPTLQDRPVGKPQLIAVQLDTPTQAYGAFRFTPAKGASGYYSHDGTPIVTPWLEYPIADFTRITSKFNPRRRHPVTGRIRPHQGIDFSASPGTPIIAPSDGVVNMASWQGSWGRLVTLAHAGDIETRYAHLSGFATNLAPGTRVAQGEVIGYVGTSGLSTGPHLHYEMHVTGRPVDPLSMNTASRMPLAASDRHAFHDQRATLIATLESGNTSSKTLVASR
ncbi:peptidoglycan DD-metalloendopeptidase family protein [Vreelandella rituensis]|uniref:Uncharacterized protein n=1 Tax=Vreelandella rituensis TaxID=2282306 RepID=A0A368U998_9GAMM|nr:peptidoglycan DD-metalloendopeptidase family protein [Halomonas rituensis]RCV93789.1 hypothetical protein DU506_01130 [Halomonas rituensis]